MASIDGLSNQLANKAFLPNIESLKSAALAGTLNGQKVTITNPPTALQASANVAEEISQALTKFKQWDKREISKGESHQERMLELLQKIQTIEKIQEIDPFKNGITENPNEKLTQKYFRDQAQQQFPDVFHQYIALYESAVAYEKEHGKGSADAIFAAVDSLKREHRQAIQIGLNLTEELGKDPRVDSIADARREYQDQVQDHKSLNQAYRHLNEKHGSQNFETSVDLQLKLLATDLACLDQSASEVRLQAILDDMKTLKSLVGVSRQLCGNRRADWSCAL